MEEFNEAFTSIHELFVSYNEAYFEGKLAGVRVSWSKRMTRCAGLCYYSKRLGDCSIRLSECLLQYRPFSDLVNTLLHEMIHAYIFLTEKVLDRDGHGPVFQRKMKEINQKGKWVSMLYSPFFSFST